MGLKDFTVKEIIDAYSAGKLSPVEYAKDVIEQIEKEKDLNAVVNYDADLALKYAKESEERYLKKSPLSKIDGIPIGIKDIIDTKEIATTYGCTAYSKHLPKEDAFAVKQLKKAGANVFVKCNTSQFALGPTGEVSYGGAVKNGRNKNYTTGGSSSGSASIVAAHIMAGAIGTDSGGSVRVPSSICGTVGIKPTFSYVSNEGVMPVNETVDCIGPITRTVEDGAMILQSLVGYNINDWRSSPTSYINFSARLNESIKGSKAVLIKNLFEGPTTKDVADTCLNAVCALKDSGMEIIEKEIGDVRELRTAHQIHMLAMAHAVHLDDIKNNKEHIYDEVMKRLMSGNISSDLCIQYELKKHEMRRIVLDLLGDADCIIYPTTPLTACKIGESRRSVKLINGEETCAFLANGSFTWISSFAGTPCISVPAGFVADGLPVGISIMGRPYDEQNLIRIADALFKTLDLKL